MVGGQVDAWLIELNKRQRHRDLALGDRVALIGDDREVHSTQVRRRLPLRIGDRASAVSVQQTEAVVEGEQVRDGALGYDARVAQAAGANFGLLLLLLLAERRHVSGQRRRELVEHLARQQAVMGKDRVDGEAVELQVLASGGGKHLSVGQAL